MNHINHTVKKDIKKSLKNYLKRKVKDKIILIFFISLIGCSKQKKYEILENEQYWSIEYFKSSFKTELEDSIKIDKSIAFSFINREYYISLGDKIIYWGNYQFYNNGDSLKFYNSTYSKLDGFYYFNLKRTFENEFLEKFELNIKSKKIELKAKKSYIVPYSNKSRLPPSYH